MDDDSADKRASAEDNDHRGSSREELEKRLAEFTLNIRANAADAEKRRREATPLATRVSAVNVTPPPSRGPERFEEASVVIAPGLDPHREPTLVGYRDERRNRWDFRTDGEIVDASDSSESPSTSMPLEQSREGMPVSRIERKRPIFVLLSVVAAVLLVPPLLWVVFWSHESVKPAPRKVESTTAPPIDLSGQAKAPEPSGRQQLEERADTRPTPVPSNAMPSPPPRNEHGPDQRNPLRPKRGGEKHVTGGKSQGRGPLGGEPEYR